jgi:hypothetical protein
VITAILPLGIANALLQIVAVWQCHAQLRVHLDNGDRGDSTRPEKPYSPGPMRPVHYGVGDNYDVMLRELENGHGKETA